MGERKVSYDLDIVLDELPPAERNGGGGGRSVFQPKLDEIIGDKGRHNKAIALGRYENATAAPAAANVLRQKFGRSPIASGWTFAVRKDEEDETRRLLYAVYSPAKIVPGEMEKHVAAEKARLEKNAARAAAKKAAAEAEAEAAKKAPAKR